MALYKPDTLQSSNTKAYPIVYSEEVGGHKQVADLSALYELGNYSPIILGSGDETTAIGQLWYVISEKSFYQLVDYSNISNSKGWSKTNLTSGTNSLSSNQIGNDNTLITSITVAGDGSMSYTSYSLGSLQSSINSTYNLASSSYNLAYAGYAYSTYQASYLNKVISNTYENLLKEINNITYTVQCDVISEIDKFDSDKSNAYLHYKVGDEEKTTQLNGATQTNAGVMTAEDKQNLDSIFTGDKDLISPSASGTFTVYKNDGTTVVSTSSGTSIQLESGYKTSWTGMWKWTHNDNYKDPTTTSGKWGTTLPSSGVNSSTYISGLFTSGTICSQTITAPKKGLMVSGTKVVQASGSDSKSCSVSCSTYNVRFYGIVTSVPTTSSQIKALTKSSGGKSLSVSGITLSVTQYYTFAYPSSLGTLSSIKQDGATAITDAFDRSEVTVMLDSGLLVKYYVYTSHYTGAFQNAKIDFA